MKIDSQVILYSLTCLLLLYFIPLAYIRLKMPFWHTQPVFHIYNLKYWFNPPGQITKNKDVSNKYVNLLNNELMPLAASAGASAAAPADKTKIMQICHFIKDYYVIHPEAIYKPSAEDILAYLQSNNHPSYFNVYQEPRLLFGAESIPIPDNEILGVISARVLNVTLLKKKGNQKKTAFPVYYIDNLCVKPSHRKKNIAPQMIQTLYHRISQANPKVQAYLFKREGQLNAIVPLVCYHTYAFEMRQFVPASLVTGAIQLLVIGVQQLNVLVSFIKEQRTQFECVILPDVSNLLHLIKTGKLLIYGLLFGGELIAVYVFRPLELYYQGQKTVECIAVISNCLTPDILVAGFNDIVVKLRAEVLLIEETAHSKPIITELQKNTSVKEKFKSPTAFFFYNYVCYSFDKEKTLIIY
jgi:ribosomal protein S18 acetylase RimI-like enzyme